MYIGGGLLVLILMILLLIWLFSPVSRALTHTLPAPRPS